MKWKFVLLYIILSFNTAFATPRVIDKIAAIVNDDVILESDIDKLVKYTTLSAKRNSSLPGREATLRNEILENLILDQIAVQIGEKAGIKITDEQLNKVLSNISKENNITDDQMQTLLYKKGINYATYCNQIRKEMLISKVCSKAIHNRIFIFPQEVNMLAKQIEKQNDITSELNLSYITIPISKSPTSNQVLTIEKQANLVAKLARNGEPFKKLAIAHTTKHVSLDTGHTRWICVKELPPIFFQALRTAKKGDIIGPIRFGESFYVLKVNALRNNNQSVFITEVNARHIFLKPSLGITNNEVRKKLEQIARNIKSGKISFSIAAKEFSQDFRSSRHQGELGWIPLDVYDPPLRNILIRLKKNQMSKPVRSSFGWHLIELLGIRNVDKTDSIKKEIAYHTLFNQKFSEEAIIWTQEQRVNSYIKILRE